MTRPVSFVLRTALTLSLATLVVSAQASTVLPSPAPAPTPAPSGGVAGPPDGMIPPPPPRNERPFPSSSPFPTPAPAPVEVRPRPVQPPRSTPAPPAVPGTTRAPTSAPVAPAPAPVAGPAPAAAETAPIPTDPAPVPDLPVADPSGPPAGPPSGLPEWTPLAAFGGAALLIGGGLWWRRRRRRLALPAPVEQVVAPPPAPKPKPKPKQVPVATPAASADAPRPAPPATALGRRADIDIAFEPLSAQSTLMNLRIRYAVTVRNSGQIAAEPVTLRIGLFAGSQVHPQGIAQWFGLADQPLHHAVDSVPAGGDHRFEGELAAPLDALNPMTVDGRVLAIPLVAVDARYGHGAGEAPIDGQSARAFVIGRDPQREGAKLAPFRLDQGPTSFAPLGQRDTGISKVA